MKRSKGFFKFHISTNCILHEEVLQDSSNSTLQGYPYRNLPESNSTYKKTKSSLIDTTYRGQRDLQSRKEILHIEDKEIFKYFHSFCSTHPCMLQDIPVLPVLPGIPPHYSILQLECIFYTSTSFHRNSTEYQLGHYKLFFFKEREMLRYRSN